MARIARVVLPDYPHHVTQRGNRRQLVFFSDEDYRTYRTMLAKACRMARTEVWAYCLMPNHVHLILVPSRPDGLRAALGEAISGRSVSIPFPWMKNIYWLPFGTWN